MSYLSIARAAQPVEKECEKSELTLLPFLGPDRSGADVQLNTDCELSERSEITTGVGIAAIYTELRAIYARPDFDSAANRSRRREINQAVHQLKYAEASLDREEAG
jgi:hypothetical protein